MDDTLHVVCPHCDTTNRVARERLGAGAVCGKCKRRFEIPSHQSLAMYEPLAGLPVDDYDQ